MQFALWRRAGFGWASASKYASCALVMATALPAAAVGQNAASRPVPVPTPAAAPQPAVGNSSVQGDLARTRFVIGLERAGDYQVFSLGNPNRVIVDLPSMRMQLPQLGGGQPVGLVSSIRSGISSLTRTRVVIEVTAPVVVERSAIEGAKDGRPRLVLDIVPVEAGGKPTALGRRTVAMAGLGAVGVNPPLPKPAASPNARASTAYKPVIVLDPGHGGVDSGAMKHGAVEKEVVLAFSKVLRDKLKATGRYTILMTRDTDVFIPLNERRDIAERNKAALFIAIHADYATSTARGATIYSLNDGAARSLQRSAKGEVGRDVLSSKELAEVRRQGTSADSVQSILKDFAEREVGVTKERTSAFTRSVIETMSASTDMQSNPDRHAAFRVLQTQKLPSVLIELAYVSNKQDALNLKSEEWRNKVATSILTAIENYFSHQVGRLQM